MTAIETFCTRCGKQWQPSRRELVAGTWHLCPQCRAAALPQPNGLTDQASTQTTKDTP